MTEYVEGIGFEQVKELPQPERDRFGEIVFRFFLGSLYRTRHFSADPHPGNYILMPDGRVAFLDFGMSKTVSRGAGRSGAGGDPGGHRGRRRGACGPRSSAMGFFDPDDEVITAERVQEHFDAATAWYREDRPFTIDRDYVRQVLIDVSDPRSRFFDIMRRQTMPPDAMFARRMEALTLAVLGQLNATANWHRIAREWLFGDPPATELGEAEAAFFASDERWGGTLAGTA